MSAVGGLALLSVACPGRAQQKPNTIKIVCGYAPGGTTDLLCRQVAAKLSPSYAPSVIVENKTGAQAQISVAYAKQQPADGSCILQATMSMFSLFPILYKSLPYEASDFRPLTAGVQVEYAFAVGSMVPPAVRTVRDYVEWTKRDPKNATFAAIGQLPAIVGLLLGKASGVDLVQVQYKGGAPAVQDAIAGNIPAVVTTVGDIVPFLGERLRLLATTGDARNPLTPGTPSFVEQGVSEVLVKNYFAFFVHAKTPSVLVDSHSAAIREALAQRDVIDTLRRGAMIPLPADPSETAELLVKDQARWHEYIKRTGYTAEPA